MKNISIYVDVTGSNTCPSDFRYLISTTDSLCRNTFIHKATGVFINRFSFSSKIFENCFVSTIVKNIIYASVIIYPRFCFARIFSLSTFSAYPNPRFSWPRSISLHARKMYFPRVYLSPSGEDFPLAVAT